MALLVRSFQLLPGRGVIWVKGWEGPWGPGKQCSSLLWTLRVVSIIDCVRFAFECTLECLLFVSLRLQYCGSLRTGIIYNYISHTDQWTTVRVVVDRSLTPWGQGLGRQGWVYWLPPNPQYLAQSLSHHRCSINSCWPSQQGGKYLISGSIQPEQKK